MSWPNLGIRLDAEPAGDAPNLVTDVDIRTDDPAEIATCMAAVRRHMGDRQPDAITGRDGLHFYDQLPRAQPGAHLRGQPGWKPAARTSTSSIGLGATKASFMTTRLPWTIELFGPKHNVVCPPSIHPLTLKPYRRRAMNDAGPARPPPACRPAFRSRTRRDRAGRPDTIAALVGAVQEPTGSCVRSPISSTSSSELPDEAWLALRQAMVDAKVPIRDIDKKLKAKRRGDG